MVRSIWTEDVAEVHHRCLAQGIEVTWPPTNRPWEVQASLTDSHQKLHPTICTNESIGWHDNFNADQAHVAGCQRSQLRD